MDPVHVGITKFSGAQECLKETQECFIPSTVHAQVGQKIIFTNNDLTFHHIISGTSESVLDKFDSDVLDEGESFSYVPDTSGNVPFFCYIHPWMEGLIIVEP